MRLLWQTMDGVGYGRCYMISNLNLMSIMTWKEVSDDLFRKFLKDMLAIWHKPTLGKVFQSWPRRTLKRWKDNMWDTFEVKEIRNYSLERWKNIALWIPMVCSIRVWNQLREDQKDWLLEDVVLDDEVTTGHAIVLKGLLFHDSSWSQKKYLVTDKYLRTVKWLFKFKSSLVFTKK